jgi:hypothetical protein
MALFGWWRRSTTPETGLVAWRRHWDEASRTPTRAAAAALAAELDALALPPDDVEVEREMLDGLTALLDLSDAIDGGLPAVETGHRIVGADRCHLSTPVSRADDESQASGRLLLTSQRAIFLGGASAVSLPWHTVAETAVVARDLVLVRRGREAAFVFRCNTYADALCAHLIAARLADGQRRGGRV